MKVISAQYAREWTKENQDAGMNPVIYQIMKQVKRSVEEGVYDCTFPELPWCKVDDSTKKFLIQLGYSVEKVDNGYKIIW